MTAPRAVTDVNGVPATPPDQSDVVEPRSLLHKLLATVRPQFRVDVLLCQGDAFHPGSKAGSVALRDRR